jgi:hypothetical protein
LYGSILLRQACTITNIAFHQAIATRVRGQQEYAAFKALGPEGEKETINRLKSSISQAGLPMLKEELLAWVLYRGYRAYSSELRRMSSLFRVLALCLDLT